MKKLILLSLLSILATGCFSENAETNPFIQSEAEKQIAQNYRSLVDDNQEVILDLDEKMNDLAEKMNVLTNEKRILQERLDNLKPKTNQSITFSNGQCSKRELKQIHFSSTKQLGKFYLTLGGVTDEENFGVRSPELNDDENWVVFLKIYQNQNLIYKSQYLFNEIVSEKSIKINELSPTLNKGDKLNFVIEYGIDVTHPELDFNQNGYKTLNERLGQFEFQQCVGNSITIGENTIRYPKESNRRLIVSFDELN